MQRAYRVIAEKIVDIYIYYMLFTKKLYTYNSLLPLNNNNITTFAYFKLFCIDTIHNIDTTIFNCIKFVYIR